MEELYQLDKDLDNRLRLSTLLTNKDSKAASVHNDIKEFTTLKKPEGRKLMNLASDPPFLSNDDADDDEGLNEDFVQTYLSSTAQLQIKSLKTKCDILSCNLQKSQQNLSKITKDLSSAQVDVKKFQKENGELSKQLKSTHSLVSQRNAKINELSKSLKAATDSNMDLQKHIAQIKKKNGEMQNRYNSLEAQSNNYSSHMKSFSEKQSSEINRLKDQIKILQKEEPKTSQKIHSLEKNICSLNSVIKKQQELIDILQKQKGNIAAAKAVECMEKEFLAIIEPFVATPVSGE